MIKHATECASLSKIVESVFLLVQIEDSTMYKTSEYMIYFNSKIDKDNLFYLLFMMVNCITLNILFVGELFRPLTQSRV